MKSEADKVKDGTHVWCTCMNAIAATDIYCPYCKAHNKAATGGKCPTCGQKLPETEE
jgi:hypothetical protein